MSAKIIYIPPPGIVDMAAKRPFSRALWRLHSQALTMVTTPAPSRWPEHDQMTKMLEG
jgi:hypothetical protein